MGLGTAFHLSERGYRVTLLEKQKDVAKVASYINGAMICPSMTASWASLSLLSKVLNNLPEDKQILIHNFIKTISDSYMKTGYLVCYGCF